MTGVFTWTPSPSQGGRTYTITVRVRDPFLPTVTDIESFTVQVENVDDRVHFVRELYRVVLGRDADAAGRNHWVGFLLAGIPRDAVVRGFWESAEHRGIQVDGMYRVYLGRDADAAGRAGWVDQLMRGMSELQLAAAFIGSEEYRLTHPDAFRFVTGLYDDVLGRTPDPVGLDGWLRSGGSREQMTADFLRSAEHRERLVRGWYSRILGRDGELAGVRGWVADLGNGLSWSQAAERFLASDEFFARSASG